MFVNLGFFCYLCWLWRCLLWTQWSSGASFVRIIRYWYPRLMILWITGFWLCTRCLLAPARSTISLFGAHSFSWTAEGCGAQGRYCFGIGLDSSWDFFCFRGRLEALVCCADSSFSLDFVRRTPFGLLWI